MSASFRSFLPQQFFEDNARAAAFGMEEFVELLHARAVQECAVVPSKEDMLAAVSAAPMGQPKKFLGQGAYGVVFRVTMPGGIVLARKVTCIPLPELEDSTTEALLGVCSYLDCPLKAEAARSRNVLRPLRTYLTPATDLLQALEHALSPSIWPDVHVDHQMRDILGGIPGVLLTLDVQEMTCDLERFTDDVLHRLRLPKELSLKQQAMLQGLEQGARIVSVNSIMWTITQMAYGVHHAHHALSLFHGDIKPANFLVDCPMDTLSEATDPFSCTVALSDYGAASRCVQLEGNTLACETLRRGSPLYMSCRLREGAACTYEEDEVYGLAASAVSVMLGCNRTAFSCWVPCLVRWASQDGSEEAQALQTVLAGIAQQGPAGEAYVALMGLLAKALKAPQAGQRMGTEEFISDLEHLWEQQVAPLRQDDSVVLEPSHHSVVADPWQEGQQVQVCWLQVPHNKLAMYAIDVKIAATLALADELRAQCLAAAMQAPSHHAPSTAPQQQWEDSPCSEEEQEAEGHVQCEWAQEHDHCTEDEQQGGWAGHDGGDDSSHAWQPGCEGEGGAEQEAECGWTSDDDDGASSDTGDLLAPGHIAFPPCETIWEGEHEGTDGDDEGASSNGGSSASDALDSHAAFPSLDTVWEDEHEGTDGEASEEQVVATYTSWAGDCVWTSLEGSHAAQQQQRQYEVEEESSLLLACTYMIDASRSPAATCSATRWLPDAHASSNAVVEVETAMSMSTDLHSECDTACSMSCDSDCDCDCSTPRSSARSSLDAPTCTAPVCCPSALGSSGPHKCSAQPTPISRIHLSAVSGVCRSHPVVVEECADADAQCHTASSSNQARVPHWARAVKGAAARLAQPAGWLKHCFCKA